MSPPYHTTATAARSRFGTNAVARLDAAVPGQSWERVFSTVATPAQPVEGATAQIATPLLLSMRALGLLWRHEDKEDRMT
jgi:hypothetical protein